MAGDESPQGVPREQLETVLKHFEFAHGLWIRTENEDKADAYLEAIEMVEAALDENLRPPDEVPETSAGREHIERSREVRAGE